MVRREDLDLENFTVTPSMLNSLTTPSLSLLTGKRENSNSYLLISLEYYQFTCPTEEFSINYNMVIILKSCKCLNMASQ